MHGSSVARQVELRTGTHPSKRVAVAEVKTGNASRGLLPFLVIFAAVGLLAALWSLASPLISVPDEQAHVIKAAAVVRGQLLGESGGAQGDKVRVQVPQFIASTDRLQDCYAGNPIVAADCSPGIPDATAVVPAYTSAGNYNPMYYAVAGLPSLFLSGEPAIYAMRIVSGFLTAAFIGLALACLRGLSQWRLPLFIGTFAITPMVLFLSGAVNPNSLEVATAMAVFSALSLTWERAQEGKTWKLPLLFAAVSAVVLANTRAASLLWLGLSLAASLLLFGHKPLLQILRHKFAWAMAAAVGAGCGLSIAWLRTANSFQSLTGKGSDASPRQVIELMLDRTFDFAKGYVSYLGWLDTPGPAGVLAVWATLIIGIIVAALSLGDKNARLTVAVLVTAVLTLPALLQVPLAKDVGIIWQGRYILALVAVLIMACGIAVRPFSAGNLASGRRGSRTLVALVVFAHFYAFLYGMRRYVTGLQDPPDWGLMVSAPLWQPPGGWILLSLAYLAVLLTSAILLHRCVTARPDPVDDMQRAPRSVRDVLEPEAVRLQSAEQGAFYPKRPET